MTELTQEKLKELLDYNPETGIFTLKENSRDYFNGHEERLCFIYEHDIRIKIAGNLYLFSKKRLAWLYVYGEFPIGNVKPVNGIKADIRISNLRGATRRDKYYGMTLAERNEKKFKNLPDSVKKERKKIWEGKKKNEDIGFFVTKYGTYRSQIFKDGKKVFDKTFKTKKEARSAYIAKKQDICPLAYPL